MVFLVLFSTVSFTVEKHFCGDVLIDISVFGDAKSCGESMGMLHKKSCCKDEIEVVKGQDELKSHSFQDLDFSQQQFLTTFAYSYINLFESLDKLIIPHKDYSPPNLIKEIHILDEVFLI